MHGEVLIDTVNILSTVIQNNVIEVQAIPHSNDIVGLRDLYVKFDMSNTTINMVQDLIASGENTSGSRFVHTHSYMPTYTRKSNSPVTTGSALLPSTSINCNFDYKWTTTSSGTTNNHHNFDNFKYECILHTFLSGSSGSVPVINDRHLNTKS